MAARGYSIYKNLSLSTTPILIGLGHKVIGGYYIANLNAVGTWVHVKTWDLALAPIVGLDPSLTTWPIPGSAAANVLSIQNTVADDCLAYYSGLWIAATLSPGDNANDAPAANTVVVNIYHQ